MKEIRSATKVKGICICGLEDFLLFSYPYYQKQSNKFKAISVKVPVAIFFRKRINNSLMHMELQKVMNKNKINLETKQSWRQHTL